MKHWLILFGLLSVTFKDIVKYDQLQLVNITLQQLRRVEPFVMTKAKRGEIVYEGEYIGDAASLIDSLRQSVGQQLKVDWKQTEEKLEIVVMPLQSS